MLGKIESVYLGFGGYQDVEFGLTVHLVGQGCGTTYFKGFWSVERDNHCKWTEADRDERYLEVMKDILSYLEKAKCTKLSQLVGKPVEIIFKDNTLKSWRILEEVL